MDEAGFFEALRQCPTWEELADTLGCSVEEARRAAADLLHSRVPPPAGRAVAPGVEVRIERDRWGLPHVFAGSEAEAYFGLGFAMAQDRLWQMDYLRRAASGTLAEVIGPAAVPGDRLARTLGLRRVAEAGARLLPDEARQALEAFCGGVNLARALADRDGLPFEFDLLGYVPEPWTPEDTLVVLRGFWWQLTGRFPIICVPELVRRLLGEGPLLEAFLAPEGDGQTIWPPEVPYPDLPRWAAPGSEAYPQGNTAHDPGAVGSNNWVVGPSRSASGAPLLASDPHVPFGLPSVWYEARVRGGELDAAGACYVGVPGFLFGRNGNVAWGLTNNISSLRDLYLEVTDDFDPSRYRRGGGWKSFERRTERIAVRGTDPVEIEVLEVDHGPVVSDVLPDFARNGEVVSLRWVGHETTRELEAMLGYQRAASTAEFREQLRLWSCPSFNFILADRSGEIGYQLTGRIPLRPVWALAYRSGEDPACAWAGCVPFAALPAVSAPPRGWLASANNPVATEEWPHPLSGTWPSDQRMRRLAQALDGSERFTAEDMARLQSDALSPRAVEWAGPAADALRSAGVAHPLLDELDRWDGIFSLDSRPACVFEAFFTEWSRRVLTHRLPEALFPAAFATTAGLVERLLIEDAAGWFSSPDARSEALVGAWSDALELLAERIGPDPEAWRWAAIHTLTLRHPLAGTPLLRELLERGPLPHPGSWNTVNNSLFDPRRPFETLTGASYRLLADLAGAMRSVNSGGQSGHPGSVHYADQLPLWQAGEYHPLDLSAGTGSSDVWTIQPE